MKVWRAHADRQCRGDASCWCLVCRNDRRRAEGRPELVEDPLNPDVFIDPAEHTPEELIGAYEVIDEAELVNDRALRSGLSFLMLHFETSHVGCDQAPYWWNIRPRELGVEVQPESWTALEHAGALLWVTGNHIRVDKERVGELVKHVLG